MSVRLVPEFRDGDEEREPEVPVMDASEDGDADDPSLTAAEVAAENAKRLFRVLRAAAPKRGTLAHDAANYSGDSLAGHVTYVRSRAWVARYTAQGGTGKTASRLGAIHGYTVGLAGNAAGNAIKAATKQAEVFWLLVMPLAVAIVLFIWFAG